MEPEKVACRVSPKTALSLSGVCATAVGAEGARLTSVTVTATVEAGPLAPVTASFALTSMEKSLVRGRLPEASFTMVSYPFVVTVKVSVAVKTPVVEVP